MKPFQHMQTKGGLGVYTTCIALPRTLYAPRNVCRPCTVCGGSHGARVDVRCGLASSVPWDHIHPNMMVNLVAKMALEGDRRMLQAAIAVRIRLQLMSNS